MYNDKQLARSTLLYRSVKLAARERSDSGPADVQTRAQAACDTKAAIVIQASLILSLERLNPPVAQGCANRRHRDAPAENQQTRKL